MTPGQIFWGSLIAFSVGLPLLASRFSQVRWRYKFPLCMLLANILSLVALLTAVHGRIGPTGLSLAMTFGLVVSSVVAFLASAFLKDRLKQ